MKLTSEQLKHFDEQGYLFFPNYFSPEETQILKDSIPEVFAQRRDRCRHLCKRFTSFLRRRKEIRMARPKITHTNQHFVTTGVERVHNRSFQPASTMLAVPVIVRELRVPSRDRFNEKL